MLSVPIHIYVMAKRQDKKHALCHSGWQSAAELVQYFSAQASRGAASNYLDADY